MSSLALKCLSIINCSPWVSYIYEKHWNVQQDLMQTYAKRLEEGKARKYVDLGLIASEIWSNSSYQRRNDWNFSFSGGWAVNVLEVLTSPKAWVD
jgi:hypothetical protein